MQTRWQYLRLQLRIFPLYPSFTSLLVLTLGFGIGTTLTFWSFLQTMPPGASLAAEPVRLAVIRNDVSNTPEEFDVRPMAPRRVPLTPEPPITDHQQAIYPAQSMRDVLSEAMHSPGTLLSFFVGVTLLVAMVTVLAAWAGIQK